MTSLFEQSLNPPSGGTQIGRVDENGNVYPSMDWLSLMQQLWSWVAAGYVIIPCDVDGTANAIQLTPKFRSEIGGSGYAHLLGFSFVAESTSTGAVTISVIGSLSTVRAFTAVPASTFALAAMPVYIAASAAGVGDVVAGVPYVAFYCDAVASPALPARMALK